MKNDSFLRRTSLLLAALMLLSLAACAKAPEPEDTATAAPPATANVTDTATEAPVTTSHHADPGLPSIQFNDASYTVFANAQVYSDGKAPRDIIYLEDVSSDTINEAVHDRNAYVEESYGVVIEALWTEEDRLVTDATNLIASGEHAFSAAELSLFFAGQLAVRGLLRDTATLSEYLDLSQNYWDQNIMSSLSVGGKVYFLSGDILVTDKGGTWSVCFNRQLIEANQLGDLYAEVDTKKWDFDMMNRYAQAVCDLDSHAPDDWFGVTWGILSEKGNTEILWTSGEHRFIEKDDRDIPKVADLTEGAFDAMVTIAATQNADYTLLATDITGVDDLFFDGLYKIFQMGHGLFFIGSMSMVEWMRAYDTDFGVLPMPKFSDAQKEYTSTISRTRSWCLSVPFYSDSKRSEDDMTGLVMQALACESTATVKEAYYDLTLVYKGLRREEDVRMLDLIFSHRVYDLNHPFGWGDDLMYEFSTYKSEKLIRRFQSMYDSYKNSVAKKISDYLAAEGLA